MNSLLVGRWFASQQTNKQKELLIGEFQNNLLEVWISLPFPSFTLTPVTEVVKQSR